MSHLKIVLFQVRTVALCPVTTGAGKKSLSIRTETHSDTLFKYPQALLRRAAFNPSNIQPVLMLVIAPTQEQDLALGSKEW